MSAHGADELGSAIEWLREGGRTLAGMPREEILEGVARSFEHFRDPESPWRRALEEALPEAAGFHPATVARGLDDALAPWSSPALRAMAEREWRLAGADGSATRVSGFEWTAVVLGGAIPMPSLLAVTLPLLLRSPVLARTASRDPVTAPLVAASLAEADPRLGHCLATVSFPVEDDAARRVLLSAPCVVATGSDETLAAIGRDVHPPQRLVAYGHRLSIALVGPGAEAAAVARAIALDVARWDQQGCLSPLAVYAVGRPAEPLAAALASALDAWEVTLPRGAGDPHQDVALAHERAEAEMRAASGRAVLHTGRASVVVAEPDARWRPAPTHRFVRVHPLSDAGELPGALRPIAAHLAGVSLDGFAPGEHEALVALLARLGASRICRAGQLQTPPVGWHHDGMPLLAPLARSTEVECRPGGGA